MRIAVNTRLLLAGRLEGIGQVSDEILKRIVRDHPEHQFYFIFDRPYASEFIYADNVTPIIAFPPTRHPWLWYLYFEYAIPRILKKIKADLFLSMDGYLSLKTPVKSIAILHDLNYLHNPENIKPNHRKYLLNNFVKFAHKADRIATVSQYSKQDIIDSFYINEKNIDVIYCGCNKNAVPLTEAEQEQIKAEYTQGNDYFMYVGAIHRRKNLANMLRAFDKFAVQDPSMKFVIVGRKMWKDDEIDNVLDAMKHGDRVIMLGHKTPEVLYKLMATSYAVVYVSLFEGFGIPIIEAFNTQTALITSNVTSMPEIAGDAALFVNPLSVDNIATAMLKLRWNPDLRTQLIEMGKQQATLYSWDKTADAFWKTVDKTMKH